MTVSASETRQDSSPKGQVPPFPSRPPARPWFAALGRLFVLMLVLLLSPLLLDLLPRRPVIRSYPSPDGKQRVQIEISECDYDETERIGYFSQTITLQNLGDGSSREVEWNPFGDCKNMDWFGYRGLFWTSDSRYFYFTNVLRDRPDNADGDWRPSLMRVDSWPSTEYRSSDVEDLGELWGSPDGTKLATWLWLEGELQVHEIEQGELFRFQAPEEGAYHPIILWSADSQALVYLQSQGWTYEATLVQVDVAKQSQTVLVQTNEAVFADMFWDEPGRITLVEKTYNGTIGREWYYDFASGVLSLGG